MKNKKLVGMVVSMLLVAVVGIGATLAYMSDVTKNLDNQFTFTDQGIKMTLDEAKVDAQNKAVVPSQRILASDLDPDQEYKNIIPSMLMDKDPTVTILKNSLNCHVFASVMNANEEATLAIRAFNAYEWKEVDVGDYGLLPAENTKYYVYAGEKSFGDSGLKVVPSSDEDTVLRPLFFYVQAGHELSGATTFNNIVVKASAVQSDSVEDAAAGKAALMNLGATEKPGL